MGLLPFSPGLHHALHLKDDLRGMAPPGMQFMSREPHPFAAHDMGGEFGEFGMHAMGLPYGAMRFAGMPHGGPPHPAFAPPFLPHGMPPPPHGYYERHVGAMLEHPAAAAFRGEPGARPMLRGGDRGADPSPDASPGRQPGASRMPASAGMAPPPAHASSATSMSSSSAALEQQHAAMRAAAREFGEEVPPDAWPFPFHGPMEYIGGGGGMRMGFPPHYAHAHAHAAAWPGHAPERRGGPGDARPPAAPGRGYSGQGM